MKKYLYEIVCCDKCGNVVREHSIPYMPRVFAEKQAKQMNKRGQRDYGQYGGMRSVKYMVRKTGIQTNDSTPRGWAAWDDWYLHKFGYTR